MLNIGRQFSESGSPSRIVDKSQFDHQTPSNLIWPDNLERRITNMVINRWENAPGKFLILQKLMRSNLWEYCFLIIPDEEFAFSAIVDCGASAMRSLSLTNGQVNSLRHIPGYLRLPFDNLCENCLPDSAAHVYSGSAYVAEENSIYVFRLAAMPIISPMPSRNIVPSKTRYILGCLTEKAIC